MKILCLILFSLSTFSQPVVIIKPGKEYSSYTNLQLRKRIWDLEKAVWQLQQRVFNLEGGAGTLAKDEFTCYVSAFGKTFTSSQASEMKAKAKVLKKCSKQFSAMHCSEITCGK